MNNNPLAYRVYDTYEKEYLNCAKAVFLGRDGKLYYLTSNDGWRSDESGRYIVERCTGTPDRNGKLIYEGDICKDSVGNVFRVEWDEVNARFLGFTVNGERRIIYVAREPEANVVGNIHEGVK